MKISNDVVNVLSNSKIVDNKLFLPDTQLDRKLYVAVNKALDAINGKWSCSEKAHVFDVSPLNDIEQMLLTGEYIDIKKEFQFFETPEILAKHLADLADIQEGDTVLEPSAGMARIAQHLGNSCDVIELNPKNREFLSKHGYNIVGDDFMEFEGSYDVIVANPPFTRQQDIDHVNKMIDLANKRVVSVMSASVLYRDNKKTIDFRNRIEKLGGTIEMLPDDSFKESGTLVKTCIVNVEK